MKAVFDFAAVPANTDAPKREACALSGERELACGSIVTERNGRIISKVAFLPSA